MDGAVAGCFSAARDACEEVRFRRLLKGQRPIAARRLRPPHQALSVNVGEMVAGGGGGDVVGGGGGGGGELELGSGGGR